MEILYVLCNKFKLDDKHDKKLKSELAEVLEIMMKTNAAIISDTYYVKFEDNYGFGQKSLSPTVYEMVKRYEFLRQQRERNSQRKTDQNNFGFN